MSTFALSTALLLVSPPTTLPPPPVPVALVDSSTPAVADGSAAVVVADTAVAPSVAEPPVAAEPAMAAVSSDQQDIVVTATRRSKSDPLQSVNMESFALSVAVDTAMIRPVAKGYQKVLPAPVRDGIRNILNNLREPITVINCVLQHKIGRAAKTVGRLLINTTLGVGGLFDMARRKPFKIREYPNSFANTLGFYGVKTGAFLYIPLVGPTTVRDLIGSTVDRFIVPFAVGGPLRNPAVTLPMGVFGTLDQRAQLDETIEALRKDKSKAYQATREFYLTRRQAQIDELHDHRHRVVRPVPGSVKPVIIELPDRR